MFNIRKNKKGFTLVELIVVIAILAILAGTAAGIGVTLINNNSNKVGQTDADHLANDFKIYMQDKQENFDINSETVDTVDKLIADLFTDPENGFIHALNEDKSQKDKLVIGNVTSEPIPTGDKKKTGLGNINDLEHGEGRKVLLAGTHKFYAFVTLDTNNKSFKVTFVCGKKGKDDIIEAVYEYSDQIS